MYIYIYIYIERERDALPHALPQELLIDEGVAALAAAVRDNMPYCLK